MSLLSLKACTDSRSPHGERGLKFARISQKPPTGKSLSSWRAWIEIEYALIIPVRGLVALLMESVD